MPIVVGGNEEQKKEWLGACASDFKMISFCLSEPEAGSDVAGMQLLAEIKRRWPELPVVMLTAHGSVETAVRAMSLGAHDFLTKPIDLDVLEQRLARLRERTRLEREIGLLRERLRERFETKTVSLSLTTRLAEAEAEQELGGRVTRECRLPGLAAWGRVRDYRLQQLNQMPNVAVYPASRLDAELQRQEAAPVDMANLLEALVVAANEIRTPRLVLSRLCEADAEFMLAIWNDRDFIRHVGDRGIRTPEEARDALRSGALKMWNELGYGPYRVALLDSGDSAGICGRELDHGVLGLAGRAARHTRCLKDSCCPARRPRTAACHRALGSLRKATLGCTERSRARSVVPERPMPIRSTAIARPSPATSGRMLRQT